MVRPARPEDLAALLELIDKDELDMKKMQNLVANGGGIFGSGGRLMDALFELQKKNIIERTDDHRYQRKPGK